MESASPESLPAETSVPTNLRAMLAQTASYAATLRKKGDALFYQGTSNLPRYTKHLVGWPFVITSEPQFRTQEKSEKRQFSSEVVQLTMRAVHWEDGSLGAPELATLSGGYLLNQIRSMTLRELTGYVWTVAENPLFDLPTRQPDGRMHPYMLKVYE